MRDEEKLKIIEKLITDKSVNPEDVVKKVKELYGGLNGAIVQKISDRVVKKIIHERD